MQRARGFSLLELLIVIVLISVLLALGIERLTLTKARAENVAMDQMLGSLRAALMIRTAELLARGRVPEIAALVGANPMLRLAEVPHNYLGELFGPDPSALPTGNWYFDKRDGTLCYLVDSADYFQSLLHPPRARFAVQPVFEDLNRNGRFDLGVDQLHGIRLAPLEPYSWRLQFIWPDWPFVSPKARVPPSS